MKNIKFKKILILFVISVILISSVSVVCFADVGSGYILPGDVIVFNNDVQFTFFPDSVLNFDFYVVDDNGVTHSYNKIRVSYPGFNLIQYGFGDEGFDAVYEGSWLNSYYQTIYVDSKTLLPSDWNAFLSINTHNGDVSNYYSDIYDILKNAIYGDIPITSDMTLSISLVSTILSMLVVLAPVLVGGFIFVWILKRF